MIYPKPYSIYLRGTILAKSPDAASIALPEVLECLGAVEARVGNQSPG